MYNPQLDTFIAVAEAGSFTKAAEGMYISPQAIIKQINLLEDNLNLKLFERTHRGLTLTEAGKSIYRDAKYMVQYAKDSLVRAQNAMEYENTVIRIGTSPMTPAQILVELWPKIHKLCPEIRFKLIPFENTPENAREILKNLGQNIDMVAGIFDERLLDFRQCAGLELFEEPIYCAVSLQHPLAAKDTLSMNDLYGENLMLLSRGQMKPVDDLREELCQNHPQIHIVDFDFYNVEIFNQCENGNHVLMAVPCWQNVHPLLKIIPVEWNHSIPFGLLHSPNPSDVVKKCISAITKVYQRS